MKPTWTKASRSNNQGQCVEVAHLGEDEIGIRDSKDQTGPVLTINRAGWSAFISGLKDDDLSR